MQLLNAHLHTLTSAVLLLLTAAADAPAVEYFVSHAGDDAAAGTSRNAPRLDDNVAHHTRQYGIRFVRPCERRIIDFLPTGCDPAPVADSPERDTGRDRIGVKGDLAVRREKYGQGRHSFVGAVQWENPQAVEAARWRPRSFPDRFYPYRSLRREDLGAIDVCGADVERIGADVVY